MSRKLSILALAATTLITGLAIGAEPATAASVPDDLAASSSAAASWTPRGLTQPAVPVAEPRSTVAVATYVVRSGDTLGAIAGRFCGSFAAYPRLASASGIRNADLIYPGDVIALAGCAGGSVATAPAPKPAAKAVPVTVAAPVSSAAQRALNFALAQLGKPYIWAASGPGGYDCSGLVLASYRTVGVSLPHSSYSMINYGRYVSRADLRPGDVIWPYSSLGHVVLYVGNGQIVEAPHRGATVRVTKLYAFYTARRLA
jgi:cell wall-associated NlpC family hydrolase